MLDFYWQEKKQVEHGSTLQKTGDQSRNRAACSGAGR